MTTGAVRVLRDRNAGLYLGGVVVSGFGTSAMVLASGVWVKTLTDSNALAALTGVCLWLPTLFGPVIGVAADRVDRARLLVRGNLAMGLVLCVLLGVRSEDQVGIVFGVLLVYGVSGVLLDAAEAGLVATTVPAEVRGDFNGLRMTANEGMKLLAPLAGAGLFARYGGHAVAALDAATFAVAALAFTCVRVERAGREPSVETESDRSWRRDTVEGVRYLWSHPALRRLVGAGALTMAAAGLNGAAVYAVVDEGLERAPEFAGVLYAVQGAGSVLSGVLAGPLMRRLSERGFAAAGIAVFGVGVAIRAFGDTTLVLTGSALVGVGLPCVIIAAMTAVQNRTPEGLVGRVAATAGTVVFAPNAVAAGAGAGLVAVVDYRAVLAAAVVVTALAGGLLVRRAAVLAAQSSS
ncbi:MFS transporter [Yinghuangia seranimata]|uniref:MFS transporter n=1 Tax=Yinghuangia seranimata TaxID=408067 RepID=UPI00248AD709|nr:MFS transporter [Yinghuangia seranimata]MDI2125839.1 MFS transporter [Yinghuangia seranimata]